MDNGPRECKPRQQDNKKQQESVVVGIDMDHVKKIRTGQCREREQANPRSECQVVLRSGSALHDLSIEFPGVSGKQQCQEVLQSGNGFNGTKQPEWRCTNGYERVEETQQ
jgi:hypothetical protein